MTTLGLSSDNLPGRLNWRPIFGVFVAVWEMSTKTVATLWLVTIACVTATLWLNHQNKQGEQP